MPRKARMEYEGAVYHVMDRGDRLEEIFLDDEDRNHFLKTLGESCERTGWNVHAYVLMSNHYHLLLETPQANLSVGMQWFQATVTIRHNARHRLRGHLFQGRYKAVPVDDEDGTYFRTVADYIHLNPVRARILGPNKPLMSYPWSSFPLLVGRPKSRPSWLTAERVIPGGGDEDTVSGRRSYRRSLEQRALDERRSSTLDPDVLKALKRGWYFGSEEFRLTLLEAGQQTSAIVTEKKNRHHDAAQAESLIKKGIVVLGIKDLSLMRKGSPQKIALAAFVKQRTVVTNSWIAQRLCMGHASRVSRYCNDAMTHKEILKLVKKLKKAICKN